MRTLIPPAVGVLIGQWIGHPIKALMVTLAITWLVERWLDTRGE